MHPIAFLLYFRMKRRPKPKVRKKVKKNHQKKKKRYDDNVFCVAYVGVTVYAPCAVVFISHICDVCLDLKLD